MKFGIEVRDRVEGEGLKLGLSDPVTRTIIVMIGLLLALPSDRARERVINYVVEWLKEDKGGD